jgi:nucleotidyltransferase substrate binding protein (TIGR01987 family)
MSQRKLKDSVTNLSRALDKLEEAVNTARTSPLIAEGTVQRFEFVIELFWKTLKRALEFEGRITRTPRETLKETYAVGWVNDETLWLDMLDCRNETSHLYLDPALVDAAYDRIKSYYPEMRRLFVFLEARYRSTLGGS